MKHALRRLPQHLAPHHTWWDLTCILIGLAAISAWVIGCNHTL